MSQPETSGPWSGAEIAAFLAGTVIPMRLSAVSPGGWPVVVSLWFLHEDGVLWNASRANAKIVGLLRGNPRCGFEIAGESPPYFGVRGQGLASLDERDGGALLERLVARYLGPADTPFRRWLLAGAGDETAIAIRPVRLMSWDYRARMGS